MPLAHQFQAVAQEGFHATFQGQAPQHIGAGPLGHGRGDGFGHVEDLVDPHPALVAVALAVGTGPWAVVGRMGLVEGDRRFMAGQEAKAAQVLAAGLVGDAAMAAHPPQQALGDDPDQGGTHHEGFHAHLIEAGNGAGRVVAVQGGEHQVAGEGGFGGGFGGFDVAGFPYQQHVRVLAHEGPQGGAEVETLVAVHLGLGDAPQGVFDRVFHRGDVDARVVALREQGIEGGGFARAGGPCHQNHPEGFGSQGPQGGTGAAVGDQGVEAQLGGAAIQEP